MNTSAITQTANPDRWRDVQAAIFKGLAPLYRPEPLRLSEWADEHFYLSAESSYIEGRWETIAYQRGIMDAFSNDDVREITLKKSARIGYTKILVAAIGYFAEHKSRNQAIWQPVDHDADDFVKDEVDPMLRDCAAVQRVFPWHNTKSKHNTLRKKAFRGSTLHVRGGKAAKNYRRISVDVAYIDELDGFDRNVDNEGRPDKLAFKRAEGATFPKLVCGSTPKGSVDTSLTESRFQAAQVRFAYEVPCPHCDGRQSLKWGGRDSRYGLKWRDRRPETAAYLCEHCGALFEYGDYLDYSLARGRWTGDDGSWIDAEGLFHNAGGEIIDPPARIAFALWTAYSTRVTWAAIVAEWLDALGDEDKLITFTNTTLGECWQTRGEAPQWEAVRARAFGYALGQVPESVNRLTGFADIQADRIIWLIRGWGAGLGSYLIERGELWGDTAQPDLYTRLANEVIYQTWGGLPISLFGVDSGYQTHLVYEFARAHPAVIATKGHQRLNKPFYASQIDVSIRGRTIRNGLRLWHIDASAGKSWVHARIGWPDDQLGVWRLPADIDDDYCRQIVAEELITKRDGSQQWLQRHRDNHYLDCEVGAYYCARILGGREAPMGQSSAPTPVKKRPPPIAPAGAGSWF